MNTVIDINSSKRNICDFKFVSRQTRMKLQDGSTDTYPCIILIEKHTGIPICYTGYEKYIISNDEYQKRGRTLYNRANAVCDFLNFLIYKTNINSINCCNLNTIKDFLYFIHNDSNGEASKHDTWSRKRDSVLSFLFNYYEANQNRMNFSYQSSELRKESTYFINGNKKTKRINSGLLVKEPKANRSKKNRVLMYGYLDLLVYEALKYDPDIALGIMLQAYSGIREGEVVNLSCGAYKEIRRNFNSLSAITLDLNKLAPFFADWNKKTDPGSIKVFRTQNVYNDFLHVVSLLHREHIARLESKGYSVDSDQPLFRNKQGGPMTVATYTMRVKTLFNEHFLVTLKNSCADDPALWAENAPYIEAYEKDYPGAHMFRHWFTMYLLTQTNLKDDEIAVWRGDSNPHSMQEYISINESLRKEYVLCGYEFQKELLETGLKLMRNNK